MATQQGRYRNLFVVPHKGFRLMLADLMINVGKVNYTSDEELLKVQKDLQEAVWLYSQHNFEESTHMAPHLKEKEPEQIQKWLDDHSHHGQTLKDFASDMENIIAEKDVSKRAPLIHKLYSGICEYMSGDLAHMQYEETTIMELFWKHYTDEELAAQERELVKQFDPKFLMAGVKYMMRAHNIDGRVALLSIMKVASPPEAVQGCLKMLEGIVSSAELTEIKKRINL